jgi:hypothetical protein
MYKKLSFVFFIACLFFSTYAFADRVLAGCNCGQWLKDEPSLRTIDEFWLLGFMSGLNISGSPHLKKDFLFDVTNQQIELWMDNYCRNNPLNKVVDGATTLAHELSAKK